MRTWYRIRHVYLDADGLTLEGDEDGGDRFMVEIPPSVIRRFFVLLLRAMRGPR